MKLRSRKKYAAEVSTASMNDIMFFLMLFFLIVSTLLNPSVIKLTLPSSKHAQAIHSKELYLAVTKDLKYFLDNKPLEFAQIEPEILKEIKSNQETTVILRIDNSISVQELVNLLEIGNKLKIKMVLATKSPHASGS